MAISDKNIVNTPPIQVDPNHFLPGVLNIQYNTSDPDNDFEGEDMLIVPGGEQPVTSDQPTGDLLSPDSFSIVSQTIRTAPDGKSVIDVVIELPDISGLTMYDVRIAKA